MSTLVYYRCQLRCTSYITCQGVPKYEVTGTLYVYNAYYAYTLSGVSSFLITPYYVHTCINLPKCKQMLLYTPVTYIHIKANMPWLVVIITLTLYQWYILYSDTPFTYPILYHPKNIIYKKI